MMFIQDEQDSGSSYPKENYVEGQGQNVLQFQKKIVENKLYQKQPNSNNFRTLRQKGTFIL